MSEIRTWDEVVAAVQEAHPDPIAWQEIDATLRALRAIGLAIVPREATEEMERAFLRTYDMQGEVVAMEAALTAGEIKPEGE